MIMKLKTKKETVIEVSDWDDLVIKTYSKPYSFQQQDGCKPRGSFRFTVPARETNDEDMPESIKEEVNGPEEGVKFSSWLARDPKQSFPDEWNDNKMCDQWSVDLWWERNFYPDFQTLANDLHAKGLIEAGDYTIDIDW